MNSNFTGLDVPAKKVMKKTKVSVASSVAESVPSVPVEKEPKKNGFLMILIDISIAVGLALFVMSNVSIINVSGDSMYPTLKNGELIVGVSEFALMDKISRDDVVIIDSSFPIEHSLLVKRVIGIPGDTLVFYRQSILRNGKPLEEPYLNGFADYSTYLDGAESKTVTLPEGLYFVMGDNRNVSLDSRSYSVGLIAKENIIKKVIGGKV